MKNSIKRDVVYAKVCGLKCGEGPDALIARGVEDMYGKCFFASKWIGSTDHYKLYNAIFSPKDGDTVYEILFRKDWLEIDPEHDVCFATYIGQGIRMFNYSYAQNRNVLVRDSLITKSKSGEMYYDVIPAPGESGYCRYKESDLLFRGDEGSLQKFNGCLDESIIGNGDVGHEETITKCFNKDIYDGERFDVLKINNNQYLYTGSNKSIVIDASYMRDMSECKTSK